MPATRQTDAISILHYNDVTMSLMASQITGNWTVYSTVCLGKHQRKYQSPGYWFFVRGINRWPGDSAHKGPVTQKPIPLHGGITGFCSPTSQCFPSFQRCHAFYWKQGSLPVAWVLNRHLSGVSGVCQVRDNRVHNSDVIMGAMASQITSLTIVYSGADQRKHQSSASLAFVRRIHRWNGQ